MAVLALVDCSVELNSVDMSAFVTGVELDFEATDLVTTNFGGNGWDERVAGIKSGSVNITFNNDFAATTVDDRLWPLFGTSVAFNVRPTAAVVGPTNPEYQMNVLVTELSPLAGSVGDLAEHDVTWPITGAVTRATS